MQTVIDKIKAEIEQTGAYYKEIGEQTRANAFLEVLSIIDRCTAGGKSDGEIVRYKSMLPPEELSDEEVVAQGYCAAEELHIFGRGKQETTTQVERNEQDDDLSWVPCSECDENSTCADAARRDGCEFGMRV